MAKGRKTGGRKPGSKNKERIVVPEVLPPGTAEGLVAEAARALTLASSPVRTPKAVMLDAMFDFERIGRHYLAKADRLMKNPKRAAEAANAALSGHKYIVAAVQCAEKVAPYIHARLVAIESRGDMTKDQAPYVIRVPSVLADSMAWQAAVGAGLIEAPQSSSAARTEALPHPALAQPLAPEPPPAPAPVPLMADQKTGRISTMMPAAPAPVKPAGSEEWLAAITAERRKAAG